LGRPEGSEKCHPDRATFRFVARAAKQRGMIDAVLGARVWQESAKHEVLEERCVAVDDDRRVATSLPERQKKITIRPRQFSLFRPEPLHFN